jgi:hypothetical protein
MADTSFNVAAFIDTIKVYVFDTTFLTVYDTITTYVVDTTYETVYVSVDDTLIVNLYEPGCGNIQHKIYPNPTSEHVYVSTNGYYCYDSAVIELMTSLGQILQVHPYDKLVKIDLRVYPKGTYLIRLKTDAGTTVFTRRMVIR